MKKTISLLSMAIAFLFIAGSFSQNIHAQYNFVNLSSTKIDENSEEYERLKTAGLKYLEEELGKEPGRESPTGFKVLFIQRDRMEMTHVRVQQTYNGVPVMGGEAVVTLNREEALVAVSDDIIHEVDEARLDVDSRIPVEEAVKKAFDAERCRDCRLLEGSEPTLTVFATKQDFQVETREQITTNARLAYLIRLAQSGGVDITTEENADPRLPVYLVDAQTGEIIFSYNNIQTQSVTNSGWSLYSGTVNFTAFRFGTPYYLENLNRRIGTFNGSTSTRFSDADGFWNASIQRAGVDAHWGAEKTLEYYGNVFGRNGVDGSGGPLSVPAVNGSTNLFPSIVHVGTSYNNAYWDGSSVNYGDGDGSYFSPLVSLDVVGHEITHGVTQFESGLIYWNESGGLNEAASDIFGNMVERYVKGASANNWKVGEEIFTPGTPGDALRYMDNPHNDGASIDHYSEYYPGIDVHYSSGIANKEFYLLSQGGTHHLGGSMTGIGADRAAAIWYYALTNLMNSNTTFLQARNATVNAASILYGQTEVDAVKKSWCMVGVGPCGNIIYRARVQVGIFNIWLPWVSNGAVAGTTGQSRPMRATQIMVNNINGLPGVGVTYRAHISGAGWLGWVSNGATAGSNNLLLGPQLEAIQANLTNGGGCSVKYRAHVAGFGWLGWVQNGATAGTTGQSRRMEALQAVIDCP